MTSDDSALTLKPDGDREVVTAERADDIIAAWKSTQGEEEGYMAIDLSNKSYTLEAAQKMGAFLLSSDSRLASVTSANLSDMIASRMEEEGLAVLREICTVVAKQCPLLEVVDLSDNAMGSKGVTACEVILTQCPHLHTIRLCNNGLAEHTMEQVVDILTKTQDETSSSSIASRLQSIHFFNNMSGHGGCVAFAKLIEHCQPSKLLNVRFSSTRADREGSWKVLHAMQTCMFEEPDCVWDVTYLDLADNTFGEEGGTVLSHVLAKCPQLQYLNIHDCCLDDMDVFGVICKALETSQCPLQYFNVSGNEITLQGVKEGLAPLLRAKAATLTSLHVEENEVTSKGVAYLAKVVASSPCVLEDVNLASNQCGTLGAKAWLELKINGKADSLKTLNLDGNGIPEDVVRELENAYGSDVLVEMVDNDEEEDADADLSSDEEDEDDNQEPLEKDTPSETVAVDFLVNTLEKTSI